MIRLFLLVVALFLMNGCGSGSNSSSPEYGSISFNTSWAAKGLADSTAKTAPAAMPDVISVVRASVSGPGMTAVQMDFPAATHQGSISNIPVGVNRTFTLQGLNSTGQFLYSGSISGITIVSGVTTNVGTLVMQRIVNHDPTAQAGPDQNVNTGTIVALDGSGSSDADGDELSYAWSIVQKPAGSTAELSAATTATPAFTADKEGSYVVELIITDSTGGVSSADAISVTATTPVGTINFGW